MPDDIKDNKNEQFQCSQQYLDEIKHALISGNDECPICLDQIENVSITSCGHRFCSQCLDEIIDEKENVLRRKYKSTYDINRNFYIECPFCRKKLRKSNTDMFYLRAKLCDSFKSDRIV